MRKRTWGKPRKKTPEVEHSTVMRPAFGGPVWQVPQLVGLSLRFCRKPMRTLTNALPEPAQAGLLEGADHADRARVNA